MDVKAGTKLTDVGVIPEDWGVSNVGAEFLIELGKMLDTDKNVGVSKPYLGNRSVQWGKIDLSDIGVIKMTSSDLHRYRLKRGDLLVCEGGEIGRAAIWNNELEECYYQKALHRLRPIRTYKPELLLSYLQHYTSTGFLLDFVTQTSIAHLPKEKFAIVPIPVPSTIEQEAIAGTLSDADALIESLAQLIAKKRQIKQGAMQELLTGKRRLPKFQAKVDLVHTNAGVIPNDWQVADLGDISNFENGDRGANYPSQKSFVEFGIPFINAGHVANGKIDVEKMDYISPEGYQKLGSGKVRSGDILFCLRGSLGKFGVVNSDFGQGAIASSLVIIRPKPKVLSFEFLVCYLDSLLCQRMIETWAGGAAQPNLGARDLALFQVAIPPTMSEQKAIAGVLSDMDAEIAALDDKLNKARQIKQGMMQELLTGRIRLNV